MAEKTNTRIKTPEDKARNLISPNRKQVHPTANASATDRDKCLQRNIGNKAVERLMQTRVIQPKLTISQPGDKYEQEADRVAEEVMRMPDTAVNKESGDEKEELMKSKDVSNHNSRTIQSYTGERKEDEVINAIKIAGQKPELYGNLEARIDEIEGGGHPLAEPARKFFEPRFGEDLRHVRIHDNSRTEETANAINAQAFTIGRDIAFGPGKYKPGTKRGKTLLAHELVHVVQQKRGTKENKNADDNRSIDKQILRKPRREEAGRRDRKVHRKRIRESRINATEDSRGKDKIPDMKKVTISIDRTLKYEVFRARVSEKVISELGISPDNIQEAMNNSNQSLFNCFIDMENEARIGRVGEKIRIVVSSQPTAFRNVTLAFSLFETNYQHPLSEYYEEARKGCLIGRVYFSFDSTLLDVQDKEVIMKVTDRLTKQIVDDDTVKEIYVEGYTDDIGTREYNKKLSNGRANEVAAILKEKFKLLSGVTPVHSLGSGGQGKKTDPEETRCRYRRVDIYYGKQPPRKEFTQRRSIFDRPGIQKFSLQIRYGGDFALFGALGGYKFIISEMEGKKRSRGIAFIGVGTGFGKMGLYGVSDPVPFETSIPMKLEEFEGWGAIAAVGVYGGLGLAVSGVIFECGSLPTQSVKSGGLATGAGGPGGSLLFGWWEILGD